MKKFTVMALMMMVLSMGTVFAQNRGGNHMKNNNGPRVEQRAPGKNNKKAPKHNDHHYVAPKPHASHHAPVVHHDCHVCTPHHVCAAHRPVVHHAARPVVVHHDPRPVVHTTTHHDCGNTAAIAGAAVVTGMVLGAIMASN